MGDQNDEHRGLLPRAIEYLFQSLDTAPADVRHTVLVSYLEVYNEEVCDLLAKNPKERLKPKDDPLHGVYVEGMNRMVVRTPEEAFSALELAQRNRSFATTLMSRCSSRSHIMASISVEQSSPGPDGNQRVRFGKLIMVDTAGSERQSKTGCTGDRLREATKINLSICALCDVIYTLVHGTYIPYRDSKLTRLLQGSFGGNCKTVLIANIGPVDYNHDETLETLRYACLARQVTNMPRINSDVTLLNENSPLRM